MLVPSCHRKGPNPRLAPTPSRRNLLDGGTHVAPIAPKPALALWSGTPRSGSGFSGGLTNCAWLSPQLTVW